MLDTLEERLERVNELGAHNTLHAGHMMGLKYHPGHGNVSPDGQAYMSMFSDNGNVVWVGFNLVTRRYVMLVTGDVVW